jgi:hypothetical protein
MKIPLEHINYELMALAGVNRGAILSMPDPTRMELVYRWFADAKTAGFRIPEEDLHGDFNALSERVLKPVLMGWRDSEVHPDPEEEFERLKLFALNDRTAQWAEATFN